ncbi:ATP-binding protein [Streptomyces sp. HNM0645]|uniref:ATP-binding protein n=1 Tax=Streptomyces sp. HNM0645 TaxID=2782343 RepID=UPI0024B6513B|nr:ATP-binding protein [Streptomyces sp. HNM0645]MDI9888145.1 ATP-binding protein [Streptomyces sp. HNM0645]
MDTAALLLTEVVANAVRHADGAVIEVALARDPALGAITGAVFDGTTDMGSGTRSGGAPSDEMESGRGLDLLEALAASWGVATVGDRGKWVWFRLAGA